MYEKETIQKKYQQTFILKIRGWKKILSGSTKGVKMNKLMNDLDQY